MQQQKGLICKKMCPWLPQTPERQSPMPQGHEEGLLEMPGGLTLGLEEEEVGVGLQGNKESWFKDLITIHHKQPVTIAVIVILYMEGATIIIHLF